MYDDFQKDKLKYRECVVMIQRWKSGGKTDIAAPVQSSEETIKNMIERKQKEY